MVVTRRIRNVNASQVINDMAKIYDPNNIYVWAREPITNSISHGDAKNIWFTFENTGKGTECRTQIIDNGKGLENKDCLINNVGTPHTKDETAFDYQNKGTQALIKITHAILIITKNKDEEFWQKIVFPCEVEEGENRDRIPSIYDFEPLPDHKTYTIVRWLNTKGDYNYIDLVDFLSKTFEHSLRLGLVNIFIRNSFTSSYDKLIPWDYGKHDTNFSIIKQLPIHIKEKGFEINGIAYQREISLDSHTKDGEVWISTRGVLPSPVNPQYILPSRMDLLVSINCDELRDSLVNTSLGKETFQITNETYTKMIKVLVKWLNDKFPKPKSTEKTVETERQREKSLQKALEDAYRTKDGDSLDPQKPKPTCKLCGKEIVKYPCKNCGHDPDITHNYQLECLAVNNGVVCGHTWSSTKRVENCPKCGSHGPPHVIRKTVFRAGIPKIVHENVKDVVNVRFNTDASGLEIVLGKDNDFYREIIKKKKPMQNTIYITGYLHELMDVCNKWNTTYVTPTGQAQLVFLVNGWNYKSKKLLKMIESVSSID